MAQTLNAMQLRKRENMTTFANKIFKVGDNNLFSTEEGPFRATGVFVGNYQFGEWEYTSGQVSTSNVKMSKDLVNFLNNTTGNVPIELLGSYPPSRAKYSLPITKVIKTEEFGGLTGKKQNKGIIFERDFHKSLLFACGASKGKGKYPNSAEELINIIQQHTGRGAIDAQIRGGENQPRPLKEGPIISPKDHMAHGELLTDIDLIMSTGNPVPLSLKFGGTLTFMNAGVGRIFTKDQLDAGKITNQIGLDLIDMLGLDQKLLGATFSGFKSGSFNPKAVDVSDKINKTKLRAFLKTAIGSNYWMVHGKESGKVSFWFMDPADITKYSNLGGGRYIMYYGGKKERAKRIDLEISNNYFDLKINIRNKQSGIYPSHIMCDYTSKTVAGWKTTVTR
jgi:hypothetical protein